MNKKALDEKIFNGINSIMMIVVIIICIYPLLYVLFASVSDSSRLMSHSGFLLKPIGFNTNAYMEVFKNRNILTGYSNTFIYVVAHTAISLTMTTIGAFVLSRRRFMIKNVMMGMIAFTMIFSGGLIPNYLLIRDIGLYNTRWALIIPGCVATYNLIVMRTSFSAIPISLEESVKIDGGNDIHVLLCIVIPLSKAVIAVMVLFYSVATWNSWFHASIYLRNREFYPLQLFLREILISNSTESMMTGSSTASANEREAIAESIKYATIVVSTAPVLLMYPFLQRYFVSGVMVGAIKG